jgi:hypothetical protein
LFWKNSRRIARLKPQIPMVYRQKNGNRSAVRMKLITACRMARLLRSTKSRGAASFPENPYLSASETIPGARQWHPKQ